MTKIIQKYEECIGCGTCAALCPKFWEMNDETFKVILVGGTVNEEKKEAVLEVPEMSEEDLKCNKESAEACPVQIIEILE
jgi:ferredoxin